VRQQPSILEYRGGRYLRVALVLCALAIGVYAWHEPPSVYLKPYGGTWLGYALGTLSALLVLWLMLLGVRKRRYRSSMGTVQGWTSAHVYLGLSLLLLATLHSGFEFGWNIHTLAYVLMVLVVASGAVGVYAYLRYPALMTKNLGENTLEGTLLTIGDLDRKCRRLALDLPDEVNAIVTRATRAGTREARLGGSLVRQLAGDAVSCPTRDACAELMRIGSDYSGQRSIISGQLLSAMTRKSMLIDRVRRDLRYRALMELWLYAHVPLSFALLAALIAHVISVFYFW
jgi:hypothetical protein